MASGKVARRTAVGDVAALLDSPEIVVLIAELGALRDTRGNKGYGNANKALTRQAPTRARGGADCRASGLAGRTWRHSQLLGVLPVHRQAAREQAASGGLSRRC